MPLSHTAPTRSDRSPVRGGMPMSRPMKLDARTHSDTPSTFHQPDPDSFPSFGFFSRSNTKNRTAQVTRKPR